MGKGREVRKVLEGRRGLERREKDQSAEAAKEHDEWRVRPLLSRLGSPYHSSPWGWSGFRGREGLMWPSWACAG